jgi:lamin tail-like protein
MTRPFLTLSFPIFVLCAACGPAPVRPRAVLEPPADPAPADAHAPPPADASPDGGGPSTAAADAGPTAPVDSGLQQRPKLPGPDAMVPAADGGDPAAASDARAETTASTRPPAPGDIRIVEVLVNPSGDDVGREWIEILNRSPEALDLSGLHVADTAVDVAAPAGMVAPGARLLLGQLPDGSKNGGAPVAVAYGTRLAFNNDGEEISICAGPCATGVIIDRVAWKSLGAAYDGHALVFDPDANLTCAARRPFGTAGDFGTPGEPNDGCAAPDGGF